MANAESIETHPSFYAPNNHATVYAVTVNLYCTKTLRKIILIHEKNRFSRFPVPICIGICIGIGTA